MSSMLEQAIVDATALREAALKNAEQAIIEKYAPQIKDAVESLLEGEDTNGIQVGSYVRHLESNQIGQVRAIDEDGVQIEGRDGKTFLAEMEQLEEAEMLHEQDMDGNYATSATSDTVSAPIASAPESVVDPNAQSELSMEFEFDPSDFEIDLNQVKAAAQEDPTSAGEQPEETEDLLDDLDLGDIEDDELSLQEVREIVNEILGEDDDEGETVQAEAVEDDGSVMQEELTVDVDEEKHGHIVTDKGTRAYDQDLALAKMEDSKYKEENEALMKRVAELKESLDETTEDAHKLLGVVEQLKSKLDEALVSNARLVYSNKTLSDASLNERQKLKIVEAIAQANSAEEAKTLHETLTATVGSQTNGGPQSLSESVNRKSNLSAIMPRRKEKVVVESMSLAERMKKLAGIN
jgi:Txe/YoeB family toxin of Txe-Axe toxin-antitoxin module